MERYLLLVNNESAATTAGAYHTFIASTPRRNIQAILLAAATTDIVPSLALWRVGLCPSSPATRWAACNAVGDIAAFYCNAILPFRLASATFSSTPSALPVRRLGAGTGAGFSGMAEALCPHRSCCFGSPGLRRASHLSVSLPAFAPAYMRPHSGWFCSFFAPVRAAWHERTVWRFGCWAGFDVGHLWFMLVPDGWAVLCAVKVTLI